MNLKQSLIENNSIRLHQKANSWQEAIKLAITPLIESGAVEYRYYERIIECINEMGPYIILAPGLAMPHARPEDGVNKTAFSLVTLTQPIYFDGEEEPVDVLFALAGSNSDEHMQGLMEITQVLDDPESDTGIDLDKIRQCQNAEQVFRVIDQALS